MLGRRPPSLPFSPATELVKDEAHQAAGGAIVAWPASSFALAAQRTYAMYYGEKTCRGRDLRPTTLADAAAQRHASAKPLLGPTSGASATKKKSLAESLRNHARAVSKAVASHKEGDRAGPLGTSSEHGSGKGAGAMADIVSAVRDVQSERRKLKGASANPGHERPSIPLGAGPAQKQRRVLETKKAAVVAAVAGRPPAYVGPQGEQWRLDKDYASHPPAVGHDACVPLDNLTFFLGAFDNVCRFCTHIGRVVSTMSSQLSLFAYNACRA